MKRPRSVAAPLLSALVLLSAGAAAARVDAMEMAITVDDLPSHGALPLGTTRLQIAERFISALTAAGVPSVYGFVNAHRLADDPSTAEVLKRWVDAGFLLGNHTYAHRDLHTSDVQAFEQDIAADEPALQSFMGSRDWHWFRYPFMHEGESVEKIRAIRAYLHERGYKVAEVTLDFRDYAWSDPYARCVAAGDAQAIASLKASYLSSALEAVARGQQAASILYGRDIKHVLLLHIGALDALLLPELLEQLTGQGVHFVSLPEAEEDPAYRDASEPAPLQGGGLLERRLAAKHLRYPPRVEQPREKLSALCR